jgi:hypothetical protein
MEFRNNNHPIPIEKHGRLYPVARLTIRLPVLQGWIVDEKTANFPAAPEFIGFRPNSVVWSCSEVLPPRLGILMSARRGDSRQRHLPPYSRSRSYLWVGTGRLAPPSAAAPTRTAINKKAVSLDITSECGRWPSRSKEARNPHSSFEITRSAWTPVQIKKEIVDIVCNGKFTEAAAYIPPLFVIAHVVWHYGHCCYLRH